VSVAFWSLAVLFSTAALVMLLRPLLREPRSAPPAPLALDAALQRQRLAELEADRDRGAIGERAYAEARRELERAALDALAQDAAAAAPGAGAPQPRRRPWTAAVLAVAVPALAFALYLRLGSPEALVGAGPAAAGDREAFMHSVAAMIGRLEQRLREQPDDAQGWAMLGRSYLVTERPQEAREAFGRALALGHDEPSMLVDYATVIARLEQGDLRGEASALIARALAQAPDDPQTLWLAGAAAFQNGEYPAAVEHLQRFRTLAELDTDAAAMVDGVLDRARAALAAGRSPAVAPDAP